MTIHENGYMQSLKFTNGDTTVNIPFHDPEAIHNDAGTVATRNIADGAVTEAKLSEDLQSDLDEIRDSISPIASKVQAISSTRLNSIGNLEIHCANSKGDCSIVFDFEYKQIVMTINGTTVKSWT